MHANNEPARASTESAAGGLEVLRSIARLYPSVDSAVAEIARLEAECTMPQHTVHVISDVHGEFQKLRHVINNASGTLRPLVERLFGDRRSTEEVQSLLTMVFYPKEYLDERRVQLKGDADREAFVVKALHDLFVMVRALARNDSLRNAADVFPEEYRDLFLELLHAPTSRRETRYYDAMLRTLARHERAWYFIRLTVRVVRNLAIHELVLAGDCWDRGPRGDRVVDYLMHLPRVSFVWGNHDASWYGACLGCEALIAVVLRISCRYRNLMQLEEGYGISLQPLERLVREMYADDPASCFMPRAEVGLRDPLMIARMQKAAAVMQFKFEGQIIERRPEFGLESRRLLHTIDQERGTVEIEGRTYELKDKRFPTIDPRDPYRLSEAEARCMARLKDSFVSSPVLWEQMHFLVSHGSMWLSRSDHLIFHGCVPVDERGDFRPMAVDGVERRGRELFEAIDRVLARALEEPSREDLDMLWYLWSGPMSPLFGKDKVATFEIDLVADPGSHKETKDPYFQLLNEDWFCEKVLAEFGVDPTRGLIVNGHVPVKVEKGESPVKKSGKAITIDGAFSEAYGDHGFTLLLEPDRTLLARHHHFESVEAAVSQGVDIIPNVSVIREWEPPRTIGDTEEGQGLRERIEMLERLIDAYRAHKLPQDLSMSLKQGIRRSG